MDVIAMIQPTKAVPIYRQYTKYDCACMHDLKSIAGWSVSPLLFLKFYYEYLDSAVLVNNVIFRL